jgi:hypothetical protein
LLEGFDSLYSLHLLSGDLHNGSAGAFEALCGGSIPSSPTNFKMQEHEIILKELIEKLKIVDINKTAPYLVKEIDKHVQEAYSQIYKAREQKTVYNPLVYDKRGHCC